MKLIENKILQVIFVSDIANDFVNTKVNTFFTGGGGAS